jgi:hypothetical protein
MTGIEFKEWCVANGCLIEVIDSLNFQRASLKITNPKSNSYIYLRLPLDDDRDLPDGFIESECDRLYIPCADKALVRNRKIN